ncbi:hypothetical protein V8G54_012600 [Vigna mungo]|uniref:Uncharacterized protein n=1 Tax=Vigna mungo TaxID=3915 RepID=A0AAQ3S460_VIGMU
MQRFAFSLVRARVDHHPSHRKPHLEALSTAPAANAPPESTLGSRSPLPTTPSPPEPLPAEEKTSPFRRAYTTADNASHRKQRDRASSTTSHAAGAVSSHSAELLCPLHHRAAMLPRNSPCRSNLTSPRHP